MTKEFEDPRSAYDYVIKGKEPPSDVIKETLLRDNAREVMASSRSNKEPTLYIAEGSPLGDKISEVMDSSKGKSPHQQYLDLQRNGIPIPWPERNGPSGIVYGSMEGGKPSGI